MNLPVYDIHCDLLGYLVEDDSHHPENSVEIGCSIPHLIKGNVKLQIMAIFTFTDSNSTSMAKRQSDIYTQLPELYPDKIEILNRSVKSLPTDNIQMLASIENASGLAAEDDPLDNMFTNFDYIINQVDRIVYLSLTHHAENRFGGGNSTRVGLKDDGAVLLEFLSGKNIAVDFSHTSDQLAFDILNLIDKKSLDIPIIASHSNFRTVHEHERNLPDDIAREIIQRNGVIGINFIRDFVNSEDPNKLYEHIMYGIDLGANLCFGADFCSIKGLKGFTMDMVYHENYMNATSYELIMNELSKHISKNEIEKMAFKNFEDFLLRLWL